jgi:hypothetical protein
MKEMRNMTKRNPLAYTMLKHAWIYSRAVAKAKKQNNEIDQRVNEAMFSYWYSTYVGYRKACE